MPSAAEDWIASLSPWPEEFGLERMHALLEALGNPQRAYPAVHVVGTNGKTTAARTVAAYLRAAGLAVGVYTSPHVSGWHERLDTDPQTFARAVERVRRHAETLAATQFETLTAAALAEFAEHRVDAAVVEAGLGGRLDATNVLDARVVLLTNVSLEHTEVLGETREEIAREKLAVARPGPVVVLGEPEWAYLVPGNPVVAGGAREAAEAFLGRSVTGDVEVRVPGRLEQVGPDELWDGAHNPAGMEWLLARLPSREWVIVCSILADKDAGQMLRTLSRAGDTLVATRSSSARALPADDLGRLARPLFARVDVVAEPAAARGLALGIGRPVLVTGSLYLLADLVSCLRDERWGNLVPG